MQANHHFLSYIAVTNPVISSMEISFSLIKVTLFSLPIFEFENVYAKTRELFTGIKQWSSCVPGIVLLIFSLFSKWTSFAQYSFVVQYLKCKLLKFSTAHSKSWHGVMIWEQYGLCKLALAASHFTVPPIPSHGPLPCDVA